MALTAGRITLPAVLAVSAAASGAAQTPPPQIRYDEVAPNHLAKLASQPCAIDSTLKKLPPKVYASTTGRWTAVVEQTDPVSVPYDRAQACIRMGNATGVIRNVTIGDFRTLRLAWINDRLLYLFTDVGHVAGVGQLLDADAGTWIYAKTEYTPDVPPIVQKTPDAVVIAAAKKLTAEDIDPKLPRVPVEEWVRGLVGPQPKLEWGVNDCGEQSGSPADRGRDFPMCAEIHVVLGVKRDLYLPILMGTFGKGLGGGKTALYFGVLVTPDGKQQWIKTLSELPALLGKYSVVVSC